MDNFQSIGGLASLGPPYRLYTAKLRNAIMVLAIIQEKQHTSLTRKREDLPSDSNIPHACA